MGDDRYLSWKASPFHRRRKAHTILTALSCLVYSGEKIILLFERQAARYLTCTSMNLIMSSRCLAKPRDGKQQSLNVNVNVNHLR
jgi:hypothetical protein